MKGHNIAVYIIIPLALFSIMSLFDNVQAQTNSTSYANQTASQQQQQNQTGNLRHLDAIAAPGRRQRSVVAAIEHDRGAEFAA